MTEPSLSSADSGYLFDNRASEAGPRFDSLSALFNPVTFRHLDALGVAAGWRCWEVGVGGPSVPEWLSSREWDHRVTCSRPLVEDWEQSLEAVLGRPDSNGALAAFGQPSVEEVVIRAGRNVGGIEVVSLS